MVLVAVVVGVRGGGTGVVREAGSSARVMGVACGAIEGDDGVKGEEGSGREAIRRGG